MIIRLKEWISKPDHDGNGRLNAWMEDEVGLLTVGIVTKPFRFEGANRRRQASPRCPTRSIRSLSSRTTA